MNDIDLDNQNSSQKEKEDMENSSSPKNPREKNPAEVFHIRTSKSVPNSFINSLNPQSSLNSIKEDQEGKKKT